LDGKQQLMLLRLYVMLPCRDVAKVKELPDLPPEVGQITVLIGGKIAIVAHAYIVTRYKLRWAHRSVTCAGRADAYSDCAGSAVTGAFGRIAPQPEEGQRGPLQYRGGALVQAKFRGGGLQRSMADVHTNNSLESAIGQQPPE
jgi:hypothetical protein